MADMTEKLTNSEAMDFITKVEEPFKSLPHLPKGLVEFFVKISPYLALLGAILSLIGGPLVAILGSVASLLTLSPLLFISLAGSAIVMIVNAVLLFMAFNPLKNREMKGWVLLFWSEMLNIVSAVFSLIGGGAGGLVSTIVGTLIGLYILFEMKPFYGGANKVVAKVKQATE